MARVAQHVLHVAVAAATAAAAAQQQCCVGGKYPAASRCHILLFKCRAAALCAICWHFNLFAHFHYVFTVLPFSVSFRSFFDWFVVPRLGVY